MTHRLRAAAIAMLVFSACVAISVPSFAITSDAKKKPKGPSIRLDNTCSIIWPKLVKSTFGGPVTVIPDGTFLGPAGCAASVGADPTVPPGGMLQVALEYPTLLTTLDGARVIVEDRRANDTLSDHVVTDVDDVGKSAYFNATTGTVTVLVNSKFAFTLGWARAGSPTMSDTDKAGLIALARDVVARFKQ